MGSRHQVGDRVHLWLGTPVRGGWHDGTVIGVDISGRPGVEIKLDEAPYYTSVTTVYATHDEVWPGEHLPRKAAQR